MTKDKAMKLALKALEAIGSQYVCRATHHTKAQQHHGYEACPNELTHEAAITALREALALDCSNHKPAPVAEPLFKPLIDLHPGLAEELKAMDTAQQEPGRNHWEDGDVFDRIAAIKEQPAQRQARSADTWVGLTEPEVNDCYESIMFDQNIEPSRMGVYLEIEAKLRSKNT